MIALLAYHGYVLAKLVWYINHNPQSTAFINHERDRLRELKPPKPIKQIWVSYSQISPSIKQAVIAAEDANFIHHDGVDWGAIEKAAKENARKGKIKRGGSTISMQLSKNLFLSAKQSYWRKAEELVITFMLELVLDKRRILEIYLNIAEWGVGIFGIEAASQHYFGVHANQLTPEQAATLASVLPAPKAYDQWRNADWINEKSEIILERMTKVQAPR